MKSSGSLRYLQINDCLLNTTSYGPIHQIPLYRVTDFPLALFIYDNSVGMRCGGIG